MQHRIDRNRWLPTVGIHRLVLLLWFAAAACSDVPADEPRTWRDGTGMREVQATLVEHDETTVRLKRIDGREFTVPIDGLSKADQEFLKSLRPDNPFLAVEEPQASLRAGAGSLVVVAVETKRGLRLYQRVVFKRDDELAYVALPSLEGDLRRPVNDRYRVMWESEDGQRHEVLGRKVAELELQSSWIVAAPADKLPAPVDAHRKLQLAQGAPVTIVGYVIDHDTDRPSFARVVESGTLAEIVRDDDGNVESLWIEGEDISHLGGAVVLNKHGQTIAYGLRTSRSSSPDDRKLLQATAVRHMRRLEKPECHHVLFAPRSGNKETIEFEFVAYMADPFHNLKSASLLVSWQPDEKNLRSLRERGQWQWPAMINPVTFELTRGEPSPVVLRQLPKHGSFRGVAPDTWIARQEIKNRGPVEYRCGFQFVNNNLLGRQQEYRPMYEAYMPYLVRKLPDGHDRLPNIPGVDGLPLDMPRPVKLDDGGWLLTSEVTRVSDDAGDPLPEVLAQPVKSGESIVHRTYQGDDFDAVFLDLKVQSHRRPTGYAPMVFSAKGDWLYVIDGEHVICKINTSTFEEEVFLDPETASHSIALSKEGLLVGLMDAGFLWILDEETLELKSRIAVPGIRLVAGAPGSSIGFANGRSREGRDLVDQLHMIDLAQPKPLHCLHTRYSGKRFQLSPRDTTRVGFAYDSLQMSTDGKFLFAGSLDMHLSLDGRYLYAGDGRAHRFRIAGEDLVYEQSTDAQGGVERALSNDPRWPIRPGTVISELPVFDAHDLAAPKMAPENGAYTFAMGFDPKTGNMYSPTKKVINVFSPRGDKLRELQLDVELGPTVHMIVHPGGERFAVWSHNEIIYFDTVPGRLFNAKRD